MKITSIKQQVKRSERYSIYIDGKYAFSLGEGQLIALRLHSGQELSEAELAKFNEESTIGKLYDRTLNLLSYRPRSEWELRDYLRRKKIDEETIDKILNKLSKSGYVNDEQFARRWVDNRRLLKPISKRRLHQELRQKHIADEVIKTTLEADQTDEQAVLQQLITRKRQQTKYQDDQKLMQYLARQGFAYDDIKTALQVIRQDKGS